MRARRLKLQGTAAAVFLALPLAACVSSTRHEVSVAEAPDDCWQAAMRGNERKKAGDYAGALREYSRCPRDNLPNIVGLAYEDDYGAALEHLREERRSARAAIDFPDVDASVNYYIELSQSLRDEDASLELYRMWEKAPVSQREALHVRIWSWLVEAGHYSEALSMEQVIRDQLSRLEERWKREKRASYRHDIEWVLEANTVHYARALLAANRIGDAASLLRRRAERAEDDEGARACALLAQLETEPEVYARTAERIQQETEWALDCAIPMTPSATGESDDDGGSRDGEPSDGDGAGEDGEADGDGGDSKQ